MKRISRIAALLIASLVALMFGLCVSASAQIQPIDVTGPTYDTPNQAFTKVNANDAYLDAKATASGTDTYTATVTPAITSYVTGQRYFITFTNGNTGPSTLDLNGLGAKSIVKNGSTALSSGDITAGQTLCLYYDGTNLQAIGAGGGGAFSNTAANNELMKSDGTNAVPSGIFSTTAGTITLGTGLAGTARTITSDGSAADVGLTLFAKGTGAIQTAAGGYTLFQSNGVAIGTDVNVSTVYGGSGYTNAIPRFRISNQTVGTPAIGIGSGVEFHTKTATTPNFETIGAVDAVMTNVVDANEYSDIVFKAMGEGSLGEVFRLSKLAGPTTRINAQGATADVNSTGWQFNSAFRMNGSMKVGIVGDATIDRRLHVEDNSTSQNTVMWPLRLTRISTVGNGQAGIGTGIEFETENSVGTNVIGTTIEAYAANPANGAEHFNFSIKNLVAGATTETFSTGSSGNILTQPTLGSLVSSTRSTATNDDPTISVYQNRVTTTDATVTTIHTYAVPVSTTVKLKAEVVARRTGGTGGTAEDGAGYEFVGTYKNVAGTATLIGAVSALYTAESQAAWDATFTVSGGNVLLQVTGALNNNVTWHVSKFEVMEVSQ